MRVAGFTRKLKSHNRQPGLWISQGAIRPHGGVTGNSLPAQVSFQKSCTVSVPSRLLCVATPNRISHGPLDIPGTVSLSYGATSPATNFQYPRAPYNSARRARGIHNSLCVIFAMTLLCFCTSDGVISAKWRIRYPSKRNRLSLGWASAKRSHRGYQTHRT